jgi:hypothetical protein
MNDQTNDRLAAAKLEIERLLSGWRPGAAELSQAPQIHEWQVVTVPMRSPVNQEMYGEISLLGRVAGHPRDDVGRKPKTLTSALIWVDENEGWARTISRYYVLGGRAAGYTGPVPREDVINFGRGVLNMPIDVPASRGPS